MPSRSSTASSTPKRAAVQAAVLGATEQLLGEGATYADLAVERIATRAGISRTAFYFYFADKREVLLRLCDDLSEEFYEQAEAWFSGGPDPEAELTDVFTNVMKIYADHGPVLRAIVEMA